MAQASAITINDGATTPVAHTFTPIGKDDKGVFWWEQTTPNPANPLGAKRLSYRQTRVMEGGSVLSTKSTAIYMLHVPTLETLGTNDSGITPPPTLAYKEVCRIQFDLAERSLKQERKDTRVLMVNLLAVNDVTKTIDDLQPIYA
jgi:hypothetical protein